MKPSTVAVLVVCGVAAVGGGWYFGTRTEPAEETSIPSGGLMFPALPGKLTAVAKLEVAHQGKTLVIEKRPDGRWGIASMHDYPVQETKLRGLLTGLTELRLTEPRTSNPSEYGRLGVEDPAGKKAASDLVTLVDQAGKPVMSVIVGHRRVRSHGDGAEEVYVRRPDEAQSWLAQGGIAPDADPAQWLDRDIVNIGHDRIASVKVDGDALVFGRTNGKFALLQPADHPKLEDYRVDDVSQALELLTLMSVKADHDLTAPEVGHAVFTTKDGLAVTVRVFHAAKGGDAKAGDAKGADKDPDVWAQFSASGPEAVKKEADALNQRLGGWSYEIGSWKEKALVPTLVDLKADEPKKAAAVSVAPAAAEAPVAVPAALPAALPGAAVAGGAPAAAGAAAQTPVPSDAAKKAPAAGADPGAK